MMMIGEMSDFGTTTEIPVPATVFERWRPHAKEVEYNLCSSTEICNVHWIADLVIVGFFALQFARED